jgi:hypothetical protein
MIHVSTVRIPIPNAETNGRDGQVQRNRRLHPITNRAESTQWRVRVWYWAYHPIIKHVASTKKCSSNKAMTRRSLTNSSKSKPFGFHFQHGPTTLAQISIHHSYLAHVLIFLIHSSIFKQTHYSSQVMVTLPSLDFYRNLSMAKQINSRSLSIHTLTSISCSRAIRETCRVGSTQIT